MKRLYYKFVGWISYKINENNGTSCKDCKYNGKYHDDVGCMGGMKRYAKCSGWLNRGFEKHK